MKYILVVLALLCSNVYAFNPNDLAGAEIKRVAPCNPYACALVEKDNKQYLVVGELVDEDTVVPLAIYVVEGKKLRMVWSVAWVDA